MVGASRPAEARSPGGTLRVMTIELQFLGAATTVTGSQFLLTTDRARILIDCGMFQGSPNESVRNRIPLAYDPKTLDAILLTHAHLDHCGLIPHVVKEGFGGPIWATEGTVELAALVLLDSGKLQEEFAKRDARWEKRHPDKAAAEDRQDAGGARGGGRAGRSRASGRSSRTGRDRRRTWCRRPGSAATGEHVDDAPSSPPTRRPGRRPRPDAPTRTALQAQPPTSTSTSTSRSTTSATRAPPLASFRRHRLRRRSSRSRPGIHATFVDAGHILGSAIIRLRVTERRRRREHADRLLGRPRPAGHADHPRPDRRDRRRLRPRRVDLRRPRARARATRRPASWPRPSGSSPTATASCSSRRSRSAGPRRSSGSSTGCSRPARSRRCRCTSTRRWPRRRPTSTAATPTTTTRRPAAAPGDRGLAARLPAPGHRERLRRPRRRSPGRRGRT